MTTKLAIGAAVCLALAGILCVVNGFMLTSHASTFAMATHATQVMAAGALLLIIGGVTLSVAGWRSGH